MLHIGIGSDEIHDEMIAEARCPKCKQSGTTTFTVTGKYVYLLFPAVPYKKVVTSSCSHCDLTQQEAAFDTMFRAYADTLKKEVQYPLWFYFHWVVAGLIIIGKGVWYLWTHYFIYD